ncbi:helix-turn-helix transcriptional regulator [Lewinella sp. W8]|uniref:helix-turn-helix transcriptional regulator n=1 Tax=Lewinella sp. W8 TaxID=2528208 RepID=UPI0010681268|nr:helix-turn-helix transcriptional regulator [Lewinella sp. W8]MTB49999.1 helix-turn-helix domain-containing protein [Lewinella sp. W8]
MKDSYRFLKLEGKEIAAWAEYYVSEEHSSYFPSHLLLFIKRGTLHIRVGEEISHFAAPAYVLVRKNTLGFFRKTWSPEEGKAVVFILLLRDDFVGEAIKNTSVKSVIPGAAPPAFCGLEPNDHLVNLFDGLPQYFLSGKEVTSASVKSGMEQVIKGCLAANPDLIQMFREVYTPISTHVKNIVDHYFDAGLNVEELADLAGLSLSSFYRAFKKEFGEAPHKWLMNRRLQAAYELLKNTDRSVTDICYQMGFKDVAHFSRRFKQHFGVPPSAV